jgi:hypothetical protein
MPILSTLSMTLALREILGKGPEDFGLRSPTSSQLSPGYSSSGSSNGSSSAGGSPVIGTSDAGAMNAESWDDVRIPKSAPLDRLSDNT